MRTENVPLKYTRKPLERYNKTEREDWNWKGVAKVYRTIILKRDRLNKSQRESLGGSNVGVEILGVKFPLARRFSSPHSATHSNSHTDSESVLFSSPYHQTLRHTPAASCPALRVPSTPGHAFPITKLLFFSPHHIHPKKKKLPTTSTPARVNGG